MTWTISVKANNAQAIAGKLRAGTEAFLDKLCADITTAAQNKLYPGHGYDTGFLHDSFETLPGPTMHSRIIHVAAPYAGWVEFGTSRMAAIPFLLPAITQIAPSAAVAYQQAANP